MRFTLFVQGFQQQSNRQDAVDRVTAEASSLLEGGQSSGNPLVPRSTRTTVANTLGNTRVGGTIYGPQVQQDRYNAKALDEVVNPDA